MLDGDAKLLRLTDFGYAKTDIDSQPISKVGTPNYAAPGRFLRSTQRITCCTSHLAFFVMCVMRGGSAIMICRGHTA